MKAFSNFANRCSLLLLTSFASIAAFAQEKKLDVDVDVNKTQTTWYTQPWVWIVGGAVFILLLVALLRSGQRE